MIIFILFFFIQADCKKFRHSYYMFRFEFRSMSHLRLQLCHAFSSLLLPGLPVGELALVVDGFAMRKDFIRLYFYRQRLTG